PSTEPAGVTIHDALPADTTGSTADSDCTTTATAFDCATSAALAPGASVTYHLTLHLGSDFGPGTGALSNTASIASTPIPDGNGSNDSSTDTDDVIARADLTIHKDGPTDATAGDPAGFDYTLTVTNNGPSDNAGGFTVTDALPAGTTFHAGGSDPRCSASGQSLTCLNATGLPAGQQDSF